LQRSAALATIGAMNARADTAHTPRRDWMRPLRYLWRAPRLLLLAIIAIPLALCVFNPLARRLTIRGEPLDYWMQRRWSRALVRCFGFRIRRIGEPLARCCSWRTTFPGSTSS
jgi:1-acyl-sn-glycerol-3-phosphate acyltransferase